MTPEIMTILEFTVSCEKYHHMPHKVIEFMKTPVPHSTVDNILTQF